MSNYKHKLNILNQTTIERKNDKSEYKFNIGSNI